MLHFFHLLNSICEVLLPVAYFATVAAYGLAFFRDDPLAERVKSRILILTVAMHAFYIFSHTLEYHRCMVTTAFEIMSLVAFTIAGTYWFIETRTRVRQTGFFAIGVAFLFLLVSSVMMREPSEPNKLLKEISVGLHISAATFGYGAIAISAVYGALYLILYRQLKRGRFGVSFKHLPSLESLEKLSTYATIVGFFFLTVTIPLGYFSLTRLLPEVSRFDPKLIATGLVWLIYATVLVAHFLARVEGRRIMVLSLSGFALALFSWTITNAFMSNFHRFF